MIRAEHCRGIDGRLAGFCPTIANYCPVGAVILMLLREFFQPEKKTGNHPERSLPVVESGTGMA